MLGSKTYGLVPERSVLMDVVFLVRCQTRSRVGVMLVRDCLKGGIKMVECPKCHNQYKDHITYCVFCGLDLVSVADKGGDEPVAAKGQAERRFFAEPSSSVNQRKHVNIIRPGVPALSTVFAFLGICSLFGGFIYAIHLWPEKYSVIYGIIPSASCFPSIASLLLGIVVCCMCFAMAQIISTLKTLEYIIYQIANKD
jgi:hypothetical protein